MLTTAVIILVLATLGQVHRVAGDIIPLDMAPNSVDDKYEGCREGMLKQVETFLNKEISANLTFLNKEISANLTFLNKEISANLTFLNKEISANLTFLNKEISANLTFARTWEKYKDKTGNDHLTANHVKAISVYSDDEVYTSFNEATRTGRARYTNQTYGWYLLHFLLTDAIQILNKQQKEAQTNCMTTYRGIRVEFNANVNREVRFGQIASSSTDRAVAQMYSNNVSCFVIRTCEGADVAKYSKYGDNEREVMIPPYEKFEVNAVKKDEDWCKTVFYLNSTGTESNLNCALAKVKGFLDLDFGKK